MAGDFNRNITENSWVTGQMSTLAKLIPCVILQNTAR
jgi:hypothetical protein